MKEFHTAGKGKYNLIRRQYKQYLEAISVFIINPVNNNLSKRIVKKGHNSLSVLRPVLDLF